LLLGPKTLSLVLIESRLIESFGDVWANETKFTKSMHKSTLRECFKFLIIVTGLFKFEELLHAINKIAWERILITLSLKGI
jgi:hypothetical protein